MSTFRPPQVPQQPPVYFTPAIALGVPNARQPPSAQWAAYQRDRVEIAHLLQRMQPIANMTAAIPLAAPLPNTWQQQAAYQEPRFHQRPMWTEIEETLPFVTTGFATASPPPRRWWDQWAAYQRDRVELAYELQPIPKATAALPLATPVPYRWNQQAAYQRDRVELGHELQPIPKATAALALAAPIAYRWDQQAALQQPRFHDRSMTVEIDYTIVDFTVPLPLGVPTPRTLDQTPATWRAPPAPLQIPVNFTATVVATVPFSALQMPARAAGTDPAVLALSISYSAGLALGVPVPYRWDQQAAYQRDRVALEFILQPVAVATAALPLAAPIAYTWQQQAAYQRDRVAMEYQIQPVPLATAAQPLGVPSARTVDQVIALRRDTPAPIQPIVSFVPPPVAAVPFAAVPIPFRARADDAAVLEEPLPPFFSAGLPLGVPPPRSQDQSAAYWRQGPAPLQIVANFTAAGVPRVAYAPVQLPPRVRPDDPAVLEEALPGPITAALPLAAPVPYTWSQQTAYQRDRIDLTHLIRPVPLATVAQPLGTPIPYTWAQQSAYQRDRVELVYLIRPVPLATAAQPLAYRFAQQAAYQRDRRDETAALDEVLPVYTPTPGVPSGQALWLPPTPRRDDAALQQRFGMVIRAASAVPALRLQLPDAPVVRFEFAWAAIRPVYTPSGRSELVGGPRFIIARPRLRPFTVSWPHPRTWAIARAPGRLFRVVRPALRPFAISRPAGRLFTVSAVSSPRFDTKLPGEDVVLTFDFTPDLLAGEQLSGTPSIVAINVSLGTDGSPTAIENGAPVIDSSSKKVLMPVQGGLDGCEYDITISCPTTNALKVLELLGTLPVRAKP